MPKFGLLQSCSLFCILFACGTTVPSLPPKGSKGIVGAVVAARR